jgi:hypothetical protein
MGFYADEIFEDYCALQPVGAVKLGCDCSSTFCQANVKNPIYLWVRRSPTGLVGVISGNFNVINARGALTSLGQVRFARE